MRGDDYRWAGRCCCDAATALCIRRHASRRLRRARGGRKRKERRPVQDHLRGLSKAGPKAGVVPTKRVFRQWGEHRIRRNLPVPVRRFRPRQTSYGSRRHAFNARTWEQGKPGTVLRSDPAQPRAGQAAAREHSEGRASGGGPGPWYELAHLKSTPRGGKFHARFLPWRTQSSGTTHGDADSISTGSEGPGVDSTMVSPAPGDQN